LRCPSLGKFVDDIRSMILGIGLYSILLQISDYIPETFCISWLSWPGTAGCLQTSHVAQNLWIACPSEAATQVESIERPVVSLNLAQSSQLKWWHRLSVFSETASVSYSVSSLRRWWTNCCGYHINVTNLMLVKFDTFCPNLELLVSPYVVPTHWVAFIY